MANFDKLITKRNTNAISPTAYLLSALFCCLSFFADAQRQEFTLQGVVFRKNATQRLPKVLAANMNNAAIVTSDDLGVFKIRCALGDSLLFRQKDYADQKVAVTNQNDLMVYMIPVINLMQVDIKDATKKQQLAEVMKDYNKQGVYNNGKTSVVGTLASPINALFDVFGSGPKQARHFQRYSAQELQQTEVDRRFSKSLVQRTTAITDSIKLKAFLQAYRPSYEDVKSWNEYDMINYIKRSYANYIKNGEKPPVSDLQRLMPLPPPDKITIPK